MYTSSDISMTIAGRQTAPHAARLIGSGLSRRPTEDSAAQLRGVCTPGRIRTGVLLQLESNTTCSRDLHGSKSKCMRANKEGAERQQAKPINLLEHVPQKSPTPIRSA